MPNQSQLDRLGQAGQLIKAVHDEIAIEDHIKGVYYRCSVPQAMLEGVQPLIGAACWAMEEMIWREKQAAEAAALEGA